MFFNGNTLPKVPAGAALNDQITAVNRVIDELNLNRFKILKSGDISVSSDGSTTNYSFIPHNLGKAPIPFGFLNNSNLSGIMTNGSVPLPTFGQAGISGGNFNFNTYLMITADDTYVYAFMFNATGAPVAPLNIHYLLLEESASS